MEIIIIITVTINIKINNMGSPMSIPVWLTLIGDTPNVSDVFFSAPLSDIVMNDVGCSGDVEMADGMDDDIVVDNTLK